MDDQSNTDPRQRVIDTIKQGNNILVTVRNNPSIDQLAACIALTLMVNELGKHGTAVFSGAVPSVITFLEPEKTLERNTDSLRDFIISLDKAKADKLRYKVEDSVVKIFITPYRTSLSDKDLEFGQGDFNVDVVVALGVHHQDDLDQAITAHGRILHDATVISVNLEGGSDNELGSINWTNPEVSSLSEMISSIANGLGKDNLIDNQVATALLTGIVAETERFGNAKTKPATMEVAARLLAAGANQELVASKLSEPPAPAAAPPADNGQPGIDVGVSGAPVEIAPEANQSNGELDIEHPMGDDQSQLPPNQSGGGGMIPSLMGSMDYGPSGGNQGSGFGSDVGIDLDSQGQPAPDNPGQDAGRPGNNGEDAAELEFLKEHKVEYQHEQRARIEPLQDRVGYLEGNTVMGSNNTQGNSAKPPEGLSENNRFALTPPSMGGTLTANLPAGAPENVPDMGMAPMLSHSMPAAEPLMPQPTETPDLVLPPIIQAAPMPVSVEANAQLEPDAAEPAPTPFEPAPAAGIPALVPPPMPAPAALEAAPAAPEPFLPPPQAAPVAPIPEPVATVPSAPMEAALAPAAPITPPIPPMPPASAQANAHSNGVHASKTQASVRPGPALQAAMASPEPAPKPTLAELEKQVRDKLPGATDMPKPADAQAAVDLPKPLEAALAEKPTVPAAPPPPVPPPLPTMHAA